MYLTCKIEEFHSSETIYKLFHMLLSIIQNYTPVNIHTKSHIRIKRCHKNDQILQFLSKIICMKCSEGPKNYSQSQWIIDSWYLFFLFIQNHSTELLVHLFSWSQCHTNRFSSVQPSFWSQSILLPSNTLLWTMPLSLLCKHTKWGDKFKHCISLYI